MSKKKRKSNKLNAQKSKGPITQTGKEESSHNAEKHGVYCQRLMRSEKPEDFARYRDALMEELGPEGELEIAFANAFIMDCWRLERIIRYENNVLAPMQDTAAWADEMRKMTALKDRIQRSRDRNLANLKELICNRLDAEAEPVVMTQSQYLMENILQKLKAGKSVPMSDVIAYCRAGIPREFKPGGAPLSKPDVPPPSGQSP